MKYKMPKVVMKLIKLELLQHLISKMEAGFHLLKYFVNTLYSMIVSSIKSRSSSKMLHIVTLFQNSKR